MPAAATWEDYVTVHGGPDASGWWVTLCWYADSQDPRPEAVGPYTSHAEAISAMQDSLLIDSFCEDTKRSEWLDDVYVAPEAASIISMCAQFGSRVTLIDPGDPDHHGHTDAAPSVRSTVLQATALDVRESDPPEPPLNHVTPLDHSPGAPQL